LDPHSCLGDLQLVLRPLVSACQEAAVQWDVTLTLHLFSQWRAQTTILALAFNWGFMIMNQQLTHSNSRGRRFAGIVLTQSINFTPHPLNVAWMVLHCRSSTERAVAMAMIIMSANCAGIYGAQIMRADDSPRYHRGFLVMVVIISAALLSGLFQWAADVIIARKKASRGEVDVVQGHRRLTDEEGSDEKSDHKSVERR